MLGRHAQAEALAKEVLSLSIDEPLQPLEMWARPEFVLLCVDTDRIDQAEPHLERCRDILAAGKDWHGLAGRVARAEAVVAAANGKFDQAQREFEKAVGIFRSYDVPYEEAETLYYWGRALNAAGEYARADEKLDGAVAIYRRSEAGPRWIERALAAKPSVASVPSPKRLDTAELQATFRPHDGNWTGFPACRF